MKYIDIVFLKNYGRRVDGFGFFIIPFVMFAKTNTFYRPWFLELGWMLWTVRIWIGRDRFEAR